MCMYVLPACILVYHVCGVLAEAEGGIGSPGAGVIEETELLCK